MAARPVNGLALCAGHGAIERGLGGVIPGLRVLCSVEIDPKARRLLRGPTWDDLRTFDGRRFRGIDLLTAGFPCQRFSTASRGRRVAVDLWPEVRRVIDECEPSWVFCENVQREPIEAAGKDLAERGYTVDFDRFCPSELGAAMRRVRWWLVAHAHDTAEPALPIDAEVARVREAAQTARWAAGPGRVLGMDVRAPHRGHRLRLLGNGVLPIEAARAWRILSERLTFVRQPG